jgi:hypothetical protein
VFRLAGSAVCLLIFTGLAASPAQEPAAAKPEPPVRLKKKPKPMAPPGQTGDPDQRSKSLQEKQPPSRPAERPRPEVIPEDRENETLGQEEKLKETMERLARDFHDIESLLQRARTGSNTQQKQEDVVKGLDELIEKIGRQQQQQREQQADSARQKSRDRHGQQTAQRQRGSTAAGQPRMARGQQSIQARGNPKAPVPPVSGQANKLEELYRDVWGHLPEALRQEMNQYAREQFMAQYGDLLKQYYATIAEKGRRKGD